MNDTKRRVFSIRGAAEELGVSEGTIKNRIRDNSIAAKRLGRRVLIPSKEIDRILGESQ